MRIAVLSDVHGNAFALRAVLDDIRAASPDLILNLGDTVWGAADPGAAWALQAEFAPPSVRGNTDERVAGLRDGKEDMRTWVRSQVPDSLPAQLAALPVRLDVAGGEVRAAHGSPRSAWEDLMLTESPAGRTRPARFAELRERLDGFTADGGGQVCVVGHTHREMLAVVDGVTVMNVGPVSRQKDGLPLARWALLTRRDGQWTPEFRRTQYDVAAAAAWARAHAPQRVGDLEAAWLTGGREP
ncbi:metallophosphoesterase family protein [Deinococcus aquaticus]|uniref:Metallophosphoesterase family protein n=1 Tax=Deinococcus aquaticus TaxID=328692 RepID=A0ABY7V078_9DEIO|nr:metallophosphoesterase family protein [Deinococcus aquaticus]WDA58576.1 metallophosphoesterase family protein [Deinococcus aquaticus]